MLLGKEHAYLHWCCSTFPAIRFGLLADFPLSGFINSNVSYLKSCTKHKIARYGQNIECLNVETLVNTIL
jgi:hypothetical protein